MPTIEERLARIETIASNTDKGVTRIEGAIVPLALRVQKHEVKLAILGNNSKWRMTILFSIAGLISFLTTVAVEWYRSRPGG